MLLRRASPLAAAAASECAALLDLYQAKRPASPAISAIPVGPPGCLAITYGKTQYNVSAAVPPIPVGNIVNLGGTVTAASNVCPGVNLQDVSGTPTGAACM